MATKHLSTEFSSGGSKLTITKPLGRYDSQPLCAQGYFSTLLEAQNYAKSDPHAYVGEILQVITNNDVKSYIIKNVAGDLKQLGSGVQDGDGKAWLEYDEELQAIKFMFS